MLKVVACRASKGPILRLDVIAHEEGAEVRPHLIELYLFYVFCLVLEEISIDFLIDRTHFLQLGQQQSARFHPASQIRIVIQCSSLNLCDFLKFFSLPSVIVLAPPLGCSVSYDNIREEVESQWWSLDIIHKYLLVLTLIVSEFFGIIFSQHFRID